ncbi:hypothetical protein BpHYR1_048945, partial [Brachionus plicatilis]
VFLSGSTNFSPQKSPLKIQIVDQQIYSKIFCFFQQSRRADGTRPTSARFEPIRPLLPFGFLTE